MGGMMATAMDDSMKKNQEFMLASQQAQMERQLQMQNYMREQQMAMAVARSRDLFQFFGSFYAVALLGSTAAFMKLRNARPIVPLVPLTFIAAYLWDAAYGSKMHRIRAMAIDVLKDEPSLLDMPSALPTMEMLDDRRGKSRVD